MNYYFDIDHAKKYGMEEAVVLGNIIFWVRKNKSNNSNFHDGKYWTYNSYRAFAEIFPFWTEKQIRRILSSLQKQGVVISGNYNKDKRDRTLWYALADESIADINSQGACMRSSGSVEVPVIGGASDQTVGALPDLNTINKTSDHINEPSAAYAVVETVSKMETTKTVSDLYSRLLDYFRAKNGAYFHDRKEDRALKELVRRGEIQDTTSPAHAIAEKVKMFEWYVENPPDAFWASMAFIPSMCLAMWNKLKPPKDWRPLKDLNSDIEKSERRKRTEEILQKVQDKKNQGWAK